MQMIAVVGNDVLTTHDERYKPVEQARVRQSTAEKLTLRRLFKKVMLDISSYVAGRTESERIM